MPLGITPGTINTSGLKRRQVEIEEDPGNATVVGGQLEPVGTPIDEDLSDSMSDQVDDVRTGEDVRETDIGDNGVPDTPDNAVENLADNEKQQGGDSYRDTRDFDELAEGFLEQQMRAGMTPPDTRDEERLIRELQQGGLGASILDARARMGANGMQSTGAMYALEGDLIDQYARNAAGDIFDLRDREEQQAEDNAFRSGELDIDMRDAAAEEAFRQMQLEMLDEVLSKQIPGGANILSQEEYDTLLRDNGLFGWADEVPSGSEYMGTFEGMSFWTTPDGEQIVVDAGIVPDDGQE